MRDNSIAARSYDGCNEGIAEGQWPMGIGGHFSPNGRCARVEIQHAKFPGKFERKSLDAVVVPVAWF